MANGDDGTGRTTHTRRRYPRVTSRRRRRRRSSRVRRAAVAGTRQWQGREQGFRRTVEEATRGFGDQTEVLRALPRPPGLGVGGSKDVSPPRREQEVFKAGILRPLGRFGAWMGAATRFFIRLLVIRFKHRDSETRRRLAAEQLRLILQSAGPTAIKLGQQMSLRIDIIPYAYARELENLLDQIPAFPTEQAIECIERAAGKKLEEIYSAFDPAPIGSASVACVFQGVLHDGRRVAVKVRRPGIGHLLAADLRAISWVFYILELIVLPPGFSRNLTDELYSTLMEELDFVREARYCSLFRRELKKAKMRYVTAPRVHFALSNREVLTQDFVSGGFWLSEVVRAVETEDEAALARLEQLNIDPKKVARRYLRVNRFGGFEGLFFHADLHPANVFVKPDNELELIDFGSCGAFTRRDLNSWRRILFAQSVKDVGSMVQAALAVLEPLPPIDIEEFSRRLEAVFFRDLFAIESKHSEWWERTSANIWLSFLQLARQYNIPMNLNTLRMIRATMLADTIAARLDNKIDPYKEFRNYERRAGRRARKRLDRRIKENLLGPRVWVRLEQLFDIANTAFYRVQRILDAQPILVFARVVGKAALSVAVGLRTLTILALLSGFATGVYILVVRPDLDTTRLGKIYLDVLLSRWFLPVALIIVWQGVRRFYYRLTDVEGPAQ